MITRVRGVSAAIALLAAIGLAIGLMPRDSAAGQAVDGSAAPPLLIVAFGPQQVWTVPDGVLPTLFQCQQRLGCVSQVMLANGASPDAVEFFHLTGWFLSDIQDAGLVQLGTIFVPWRANENTQTALLGGMPAVVYPEMAARDLDVTRDADYQTILAVHPNVMFWAPGPTVDGMAPSPDGGQRFLLRYRLLDGCHACAILGWVHTAFDFGPDGTYEGLRILSVET